MKNMEQTIMNLEQQVAETEAAFAWSAKYLQRFRTFATWANTLKLFQKPRPKLLAMEWTWTKTAKVRRFTSDVND